MKPLIESLEEFDSSEDCVVLPHPYEKPNPLKDSEKAGSFFQDIDAFVSYRAEFKDESDFWVNLAIQSGLNNGTQLSISQWTNVNEQLKLLKDLNRITHDAICFIERNNLHNRRS